MKIKVIFFMLLATAFTTSFVNAGIFIEPLNEIYNYGDQLTVRTNLIPSSAMAGHYTADLKCGTNLTINIFNQFFNLLSGAEQPVQITTQLTNPLLNNLSSSCYLLANYGGEVASSSSFDLSNVVLVEIELEFDELSPFNILSRNITMESSPGKSSSINSVPGLGVLPINL